MRFLIAGLGSIGRRHMRNLQQLGETDILLYRTLRGTLPEDDLGSLPAETGLDAALAASPDAVIISNPTALHLEVAIPAARAGCHLLIEKPISHTLGRIGDLRTALAEGGGRLLVGYHLRFDPGLQTIAGLLSEGAIGRAVSFRAHWGEYLPGWHPWEDYRQGYSARADLGGGVVLTLSHALDYARWLMGEVANIWAFAGQLGDLDIQVEDTAEIGLQFDGGAAGTIHLDYLQQPPRHQLEIIGTQGTLQWDASDSTARMFRPENGGWEAFPPPPGFERNDLFLAEMEHFIELVKSGTPSRCTLDDGARALELSLAALRSAEEGNLINI
ncbi:MAG: Gfo/Idh/MocA family oxidoreductase [Anaerolineales bacterium]|nr:Gfo/Idh/MocA family oxidoreductase [Anaerolineales bacterium]